MDDLTEDNFGNAEEEFAGEKYFPPYDIPLKIDEVDEEICESETTSSSGVGPVSGNILDRLIVDPQGRRPPRLGKWPINLPKSESDIAENAHQFRAAKQPTTLSQMCSLRITSEPNVFRQPAIVGTIGPASIEVDNLVELLDVGMNIARISMAHPGQCSSREAFLNVVQANNQLQTMRDFQVPVATMMDLKGPEIRTGNVVPSRAKEPVILKENGVVKLTTNKSYEDKCSEKIIYIDYKGPLCKSLEESIIFISSGLIKLTVMSVERTSLLCSVDVGGTLKSHQTVFITKMCSQTPTISEYDQECLNLAVEMDVDIVVIPRVRNDETIKLAKKLLNEISEDNNILVFAKISTYEGLENINGILKVADGIVIKKNDLSSEISPEKIFVAQKEIIGKCNKIGKPVLCTAQISPAFSPNDALRRIEMNDIGATITDGADGIILIKETALGDEAVAAVTQLSTIMREAEAATMQKPFYFDLLEEQPPSVEPCRAIALAAVQVANKIQASAILAITTSGKTAKLLSWFRPRRPVIAITRVGKTARQLNLWRAVLPLHFSAPLLPDWFHDVKARFEYGISYGKELGIIKSGDLLVLVSGYRKKAGFTNCIRIVFAALEKKGFWDDATQYYASSKPGNNK